MSVSKNSQNQDSQEPIFSIEFVNTEQDLVEWNKFFIKNNINNSKRKLVLLLLIFPALMSVCIFIYYILYATSTENTGFNIVVAILISIITFLFSSLFIPIFYFFQRWLILFIAKINAKHIAGFLDKHKLNFYENYYLAITKDAESKLKYTKFIDLYENQNYLFAALSKKQAVVLPKKYFTDQQIDFIKTKIKPNIK